MWPTSLFADPPLTIMSYFFFLIEGLVLQFYLHYFLGDYMKSHGCEYNLYVDNSHIISLPWIQDYLSNCLLLEYSSNRHLKFNSLKNKLQIFLLQSFLLAIPYFWWEFWVTNNWVWWKSFSGWKNERDGMGQFQKKQEVKSPPCPGLGPTAVAGD